MSVMLIITNGVKRKSSHKFLSKKQMFAIYMYIYKRMLISDCCDNNDLKRTSELCNLSLTGR